MTMHQNDHPQLHRCDLWDDPSSCPITRTAIDPDEAALAAVRREDADAYAAWLDEHAAAAAARSAAWAELGR